MVISLGDQELTFVIKEIYSIFADFDVTKLPMFIVGAIHYTFFYKKLFYEKVVLSRSKRYESSVLDF